MLQRATAVPGLGRWHLWVPWGWGIICPTACSRVVRPIYISIAQSKEPVVVSPMLSNVGLCWAGMFPHSPYKGCGRRYSGLMKKEGDDECSQSPHQLFELYM